MTHQFVSIIWLSFVHYLFILNNVWNILVKKGHLRDWMTKMK